MKARPTENQRKQAVAMVKDQGLSYRKVAVEIGVDAKTVWNWCN